MSGHLPLLMAKFPGKLMLDVDDIAAAMDYSKGHIYNLISKNKLPFKLAHDMGDKNLVSIVELSDYLDSKLLSRGVEAEAQEKNLETPKRKVGRPRRTTKASLQVRCFQAELRTAIYQYETKCILSELRVESKKITLLADEKYSCADRFETAKTAMMHNVGRVEALFENVEIELLLHRPKASKQHF